MATARAICRPAVSHSTETCRVSGLGPRGVSILNHLDERGPRNETGLSKRVTTQTVIIICCVSNMGV